MRMISKNNKRGSAPLWTIFIAIVLISFSLLIYTAMSVQNNYRQAQTEIERAATISININVKNQAVRDIQMAADLNSVRSSLEQNLIDLGYIKQDSKTWMRKNDHKTIYTLENLTLIEDGDQVVLSGELNISLLAGTAASIKIPINTKVQAIFIDY